MARLSILIDVNKCNGCYNCFLSCRDEYYDNEYPGYSAAQPLNGQFWMQIKEIERGVYPRPKLSYIPMPCLHCKDAPCIDASKNGAVYRRDDGIVMIDPKKAEGQQDIVNACPYRAIFWNEEKQAAQKCTMCAHRIDEGAKEPRCVESCPTGALVFGDLDDPDSEISKLSKTLKTEVFHPEFKTSPSVMYSGIPKKFIAGEIVLKDRQDECAKGVKVKLEGEGVKLETRTDNFGDFEFEGLEKNKKYKITVEQSGYNVWQYDLKMLTDINLGEIVLEPR
ncbi:4Fe-4S ferredoxin iron-sulfur binding domain-containing protein [Desulfonema limicola]|uniref:4Fe-4S ferredoxin iron-sulfur binding domain-containing protein n=1 Tax=Desulfonema limicola TaxID=45656 RepID=A0A975B7G9_9BACT|nr:4Fe-4S dicluster domain-containing protein [Desulfonema limicola]QTA80102.1 4Fe-4S ferredoxin iron-sulfur binding domain-containing protein [Desulfonema limicola]